MFVVTADQKGSTHTGVRVEQILSALEPWSARWHAQIALPPERTVGDEIQAVVTSADAALDLALLLMRHHEWSVGIGVGEVDLPLGDSARASSGEAFIHARRAVERARGRSEPVPLVIAGADANQEEAATAIAQLIASVVRRRTAAGWEVSDLLAPGATQRDAARALGISAQAVSQRITSAMLDEERRARPVAAMLLQQVAPRGETP